MLTFKQFCRFLDEESASKRMEKAYQKKKRQEKIEKLIANSPDHWSGLS